MKAPALLADAKEAQWLLGNAMRSHKLGVAITHLEDLAVRSTGSSAHHSLIWALGAAGRAAASDEGQGYACLLDCAAGHLDAAIVQLRAEAAH